MAVSTYIKKQGSQINHQKQLKLAREKQSKPNASRREKIKKVR